MSRNPHLGEEEREVLVDLLAARIRDEIRVRPGPRAAAALTAGTPIILTGREAEYAARAALAALDEDASLEVRHYAPAQDAYDAACKALERHRQRADKAEKLAVEMEAEGVDRMAERLLAETGMRALQIREGKAELEVEPARELAAIWVGAARTMLDGGENYSETPVEFEVGLAGGQERYVLIVQRVGKVTPHQARVEAEERAEQAEKLARSAEREAARLRLEISRLRSANPAGTHLDRFRETATTEGDEGTTPRASQ